MRLDRNAKKQLIESTYFQLTVYKSEIHTWYNSALVLPDRINTDVMEMQRLRAWLSREKMSAEHRS